MTNIWMGVSQSDARPDLDLGVETNGLVSNAWSNPLTTHELHHSQIEQLISLCAKKFEWEFVINPQLTPRSPNMGDLPLNMGIAAHEAVSSILKGSETSSIDNAYDQRVLPCLTDPNKEEAVHNEYQTNVFAALDWISNHLNYKKLSSEQSFIVPEAHSISPILADIDKKWKLAGTMDLVQFNDDNGTADIVDLKFRGRSAFNRNKSSSQAAMYGTAVLYYGYMPTFTYVEVIKGKVVEQKIDLTNGRFDWFYIKAKQAIDFMESGIYPLSPHDWWCSKRYCKYWDVCRGKYEPDAEADEES